MDIETEDRCSQDKGHNHAWKQIHKYVNDFCDTFSIPYKWCSKFCIKKVEYLSLFIYDSMPEGYNEQGIRRIIDWIEKICTIAMLVWYLNDWKYWHDTVPD